MPAYTCVAVPNAIIYAGATPVWADIDPRTLTLDPASAEAVGDLLSQQAEPSFVSAAYFLEFKFEPGRYALAGREMLDGREVLRIEYHPARLFNDDHDTRVEVGADGARARIDPETLHG